MDKLQHHLGLPLGVQLPTPVTLATHCLVQRHVLVEQMETGQLLNLLVKVCVSLLFVLSAAIRWHILY